MPYRNQEELATQYLKLLKKVLTASIYDESSWSIIHSGTPGLAIPKLYRPLAVFFRDILVKFLRKNSLLLVKQRPYNAEAREGGRGWPLFGYTMVGDQRLDNVQFCVEQVLKNNILGDFIETGVWRGGTAILMRSLLQLHGVKDRVVWLADSFEGLPAPASDDDGWDMSEVSYMKVSLEQVKSNFSRFGLLDEQVKLLPGWFSDTLPTASIEKLAILRLDGDLHSSTMCALQSLYFKVARGGYVIVDDYDSWPGCKRAVTEFLAANSLEPKIESIDGIGVYWKV